MKKVILFILILLFILTNANAGPFEENVEFAKKKDYVNAFLKAKEACEQGVSRGCSAIGVYYFNGQGVKQDIYKGVTYMEMACGMGETISCLGVGSIYAYGHNQYRPIDKEKGFETMKKGCDNDFTYLCYYLGVLYEEGRGTKQDYAKALDIYERSCNLNGRSLCGCFYAGKMYEEGRGVKKDIQKANDLFKIFDNKHKLCRQQCKQCCSI